MSSSDEGGSSNGSTSIMSQDHDEIKYKGIRRRKWGKWVSEIRVPGTQDRIWLGSYSTPEGAAAAHDVASYCLRGTSYLHKLNFPLLLPPTARAGLSPRSVHKAASDAGMAVDARYNLMKGMDDVSNSDSFGSSSSSGMLSRPEVGCENGRYQHHHHHQVIVQEGEALSISVDDYLYDHMDQV